MHRLSAASKTRVKTPGYFPVFPLVIFLLLSCLLTSCSPATTPAPLPTSSFTPSFTSQPSATHTLIPTTSLLLDGSGGGVVAWASWQRNEWQVYASNADGSSLQPLTRGVRGGYEPRWSPDGSQLVFQYGGLFLLDLASGTIERLPLQGGSVELPNEYLVKPSWSPGGEWIAFLNESGLLGDIYLVHPDGTGLARLTWTNDISRDANLAWSPDGSRLAFSAERDGRIDIFTTDIQAALQGPTDPLRLTDGPGFARNLVTSWSPDGTRLAFSSDRETSTEIYIMDLEGGAVTRLTENRFSDVEPDWSPDGGSLAFSSNRDGNMEIYILDVQEALQSGGDAPARRLTDYSGDDSGPVWMPVP